MRICCLAMLMAGLATAAAAQDLPGEPGQGQLLAEAVCAECHAVDRGDREGELPDPPAFQRLADDPAMTALALRVFLQTPHAEMPDLILTAAETDDIIAFILSLKQ